MSRSNLRDRSFPVAAAWAWNALLQHVRNTSSLSVFCQELKTVLLRSLFPDVNVNQSTCIAPCMVQTTLQCPGMDHTAFNLQRTPCLPLPRKRSPDDASTECGGEHLIAAYYSFIDFERMKR